MNASVLFTAGESRAPGVSTFRFPRGKIVRVARADFRPFDPFCAVWPLFALLAGSVDGWKSEYRY
jgi:hypothetical protein